MGAAGVLVSAYTHWYLYFWGGYRGISVDRVLGIDISRSFALEAVVGLVVAELLVLALRFDALAVPAATIGTGFALAALAAYTLSRTSGLLGFTETGWSAEAVVAKTAEVVAAASLGWFLVAYVLHRKEQHAPARAS